jgi:DNA polymerase-4
VRLLWGVGPVTEAKLADAGIRTVGELASAQPALLRRLLGPAAGSKLGDLAVNADPRHVDTGRRASSVGAQSALGRREATEEVLRVTLGYLADRVATRLRAKGRAGRTVTVRVRFRGMRSVTRSTTLPAPVATTLTLTEVGVDLARSALADHPGEKEITLLAVSVSHLADEPALQLEIPLGLEGEERRPGTPRAADRWALDHSMDRVRDRFGKASVGYAAVALSGAHVVPEEFRELAQHDGDGSHHHDRP